MLPRLHRLTKKKDFDATYQQGKAVGGKLFLIRFKPNQEGRIRVGIVISKKVAKKAVTRNKLKRRIREIVRSVILKSKESVDLVIIVKKAAASASYLELESEWKNILTKIF